MTDKFSKSEVPLSLEGFNPFAYMHSAAFGDLAALRALANWHCQQAGQNGSIVGITEALVYARLAAARGASVDVGRLMAILAVAGDIAERNGWPMLASQLLAEGVAHCAVLADAGVDMATAGLARAMLECSPDVLAASTLFKEKIDAAAGLGHA